MTCSSVSTQNFSRLDASEICDDHYLCEQVARLWVYAWPSEIASSRGMR